MGWFDYKPYVPVAQRRAQAAREVARRLKKGEKISPVKIAGRAIATTFWGKAWCTNLEGYSDYANRLPRGRSYVRNGSIIDLKIKEGRIDACVSGSELYEIRIDIAPLPKAHWQALKKQCAGQIGSLVELLQGRLSKAVMEHVTDRERGLFPKPKEIKMHCSCPDYAGMCKHLAAVLYGVGNRLDSSPELLFLLRSVDHLELIEQAIPAAPPKAKHAAPQIAAKDLGDIFGIEVDEAPTTATVSSTRKKPAPKAAVKPAPAAKTAPISKKAPAKQKAPVAKKAVVAKEVLATKKAAAKKAPAGKKAVADEKAPIEKKARAKQKVIAEAKAPLEKKASVGKKTPIEEKKPAAKQASTTKKPSATKQVSAGKKPSAIQQAPAKKQASAAKKAAKAAPARKKG